MKQILVVDDELLILYALSKSLKGNGIEVKTAGTGREALQQISSSFYDLCFLDIYLPDINGLDLMKTVRELSPSTRIVVMTVSDNDADMKRAVEEGAFRFILKPFDISLIRAVAREALEMSEDIDKGCRTGGDIAAAKRRHSGRKAFKKIINYSIEILKEKKLKILHLKGEALDISSSGIGMHTDYPLRTGQTVRFCNEIEYTAGVVIWSIMNNNNNNYRAGIRFL